MPDHFSAWDVQRNVDRLGKRWALLDMVILEQPENLLLCKVGGLVVDGAVAKMKHQPRIDPVAAHRFRFVSQRNYFAGCIAEQQKAIDRTLLFLHRNLLAQ